MKKVGIIGIPLGYGAGQMGSELGVNAMRMSHVRGRTLVEHIRSLGYEVMDHGDVPIETPADGANVDSPRYINEMLVSSESIVDRLRSILANDEFPVILGGDHAIAIPTFSAISDHYRTAGKEIGLIWFDAHADINTPETSPSQNIHGMPLAAILGHGDDRLTGLCGFSPKLDQKYLAHVGARDVDPGERSWIQKLGLREQFFTMSDIDSRGMRACVEDAIAIASEAPGGFAVTFDIDSIDP
ncbi:MAG: arginase, partial [Acidobacteria bacterium]|nr:arginase [Acidobacteriota bacterium]